MLLDYEECKELAKVCYRYVLTVQEVDDGPDLRYTTYGIQAEDPMHDVVVSFPDISTKKAFVQDIVDRCNKHQLDAMHLEDVLLDEIE